MIEILCTAVSERADLFARTMASLLPRIDVEPVRLLVHEDVKPGSSAGAIAAWLRVERALGKIADCWHHVEEPARGVGRAWHRLLHASTTPIALVTAEDFDFTRPLPLRRALDLMARHDLDHIAFGKRTTPAVEHAGEPDERRNVECTYDGQPLTVAHYWRSTPSLWRVDSIRPLFDRLIAEDSEPERWAMVKVNRMMDAPRMYLWGGIGEPPFIAHTGGDRRAEIQSIAHYGASQ